MTELNPLDQLEAMNQRDAEFAQQHGLDGFRLQFRDIDSETSEEVSNFLSWQAPGILAYTVDHLGVDLNETSPRIILGSRRTLDRDRGLKTPTSRDRVEAEFIGVKTTPALTKYQKLMHDFTSGHYNRSTRTIVVDVTRSPEEYLERFRVICHELSHLKDHIEKEEYAGSSFAGLAKLLGQNSLLGVVVGATEYLTRKGERRARTNEEVAEAQYFQYNTIA